MTFVENLRETNPSDYLPVDRYCAIADTLYEHDICVYPIELHHTELGDFMQLRLSKRGDVNNPGSIICSFDEKHMVLIGTAESVLGLESIGILARGLGQELNDENTKVIARKGWPDECRVTLDFPVG